MDYELTMGQKAIGKVQLRKEGLYYCVSCRCQKPGEEIYRLAVSRDGKRESLGILAPMGLGYGLDRRVPVSHLGTGELQFQLVPSHEPLEGKFVPISPTEPFAYLQDLKDAHLAIKEGQMGAMLPKE